MTHIMQQGKSLILLLLAASSLLVIKAWVLSSSSSSVSRPRRLVSRVAAAAFSKRNSQQQQRQASSRTSLNMVESIALGSEASRLANVTDHDQVGQEMAGSIQRWLDAEWMPQDIHVRMGESCRRSYVKCRVELQTDDLMTIMMQVADDLQKDWNRDYNADAFVNAWDVANYVSDYLTAKSGIPGCECNAKIH
jgi:hypothetical protein